MTLSVERLSAHARETYPTSQFFQGAREVAANIEDQGGLLSATSDALPNIDLALASRSLEIGDWESVRAILKENSFHEGFWPMCEALLTMGLRTGVFPNASPRNMLRAAEDAPTPFETCSLGAYARLQPFIHEAGMIEAQKVSEAASELRKHLLSLPERTFSSTFDRTSQERRQDLQNGIAEGFLSFRVLGGAADWGGIASEIRYGLSDLIDEDAARISGTLFTIEAIINDDASRLKDRVGIALDQISHLNLNNQRAALSVASEYLTAICDVAELANFSSFPSPLREFAWSLDSLFFNEQRPKGMKLELDDTKGRNVLIDALSEIQNADWRLELLRGWTLSLCHRILGQRNEEMAALDLAIAGGNLLFQSGEGFGIPQIYERAVSRREAIGNSASTLEELPRIFVEDDSLAHHSFNGVDCDETIACLGRLAGAEILPIMIEMISARTPSKLPQFLGAVAASDVEAKLPSLRTRRWISS